MATIIAYDPANTQAYGEWAGFAIAAPSVMTARPGTNGPKYHRQTLSRRARCLSNSFR
jgi:hypothetical protein